MVWCQRARSWHHAPATFAGGYQLVQTAKPRLLGLGHIEPTGHQLAVIRRLTLEEVPRFPVGLELLLECLGEDETVLLVGVDARFRLGTLRECGEAGGRHSLQLGQLLDAPDVDGAPVAARTPRRESVRVGVRRM